MAYLFQVADISRSEEELLDMNSCELNTPTIPNGDTIIPTPVLGVMVVESPDIWGWIDKLAFCESGNRSDIVILDTNGRYSYGCLQFQEATFRQYVARYNMLPHATHDEVMNLIFNCDFQKKLAHKMLEENYKNWRHWYNCSTKKIGLP